MLLRRAGQVAVAAVHLGHQGQKQRRFGKLAQVLPFFDADVVNVLREFEEAVYASK